MPVSGRSAQRADDGAHRSGSSSRSAPVGRRGPTTWPPRRQFRRRQRNGTPAARRRSKATGPNSGSAGLPNDRSPPPLTAAILASRDRLPHNFGVSFEPLIYRLHNPQLINAQGRDQRRAAGWHGLLRQIERPDISERRGPTTKKSLVTRHGSKPEPRPPGCLVARALAGNRQGAISARPPAGLLGADPDALLAQLRDVSQDILEADEKPRETERLSDDDLFEGDLLVG